MKIDEAVSRIENTSKSIFAWEREGYIHIAFNTFTVLVVPYEAKTMFDCHFVNPNIELPADIKAQISRIIGKFLRTPINERFPEKKYCLRWIDDKLGKTFLGFNNQWNEKFWSTYGVPTSNTIFTESELEQLKKDNPRLAPAIDVMKEPVEDKDNDND